MESLALTKREAIRLPSWLTLLGMSPVETASYVKWEVERDTVFNEDLPYIEKIQKKMSWCKCLVSKRDLVNLSFIANTSNFQVNRFQAEKVRNQVVHFRQKYPVFSWFS